MKIFSFTKNCVNVLTHAGFSNNVVFQLDNASFRLILFSYPNLLSFNGISKEITQKKFASRFIENGEENSDADD